LNILVLATGFAATLFYLAHARRCSIFGEDSYQKSEIELPEQIKINHYG
jgi:hypothetical protein